VSKKVAVEVDGRELTLSNLDKVLYPAVGFSKGEVVDYYTRIAPALLPHLAGRPLTMKRYPDGVEGKFFFEKRAPTHTPDWVDTVRMPSSDGPIDHVCVGGLATLVWVANLASLELHTSLARGPDVRTPTMVAFDLDPGEGAALPECITVALKLRAVLGNLGLEAFPKVSGGKGLQVYVPLNADGVTYEQTSGFARALAQAFEADEPGLVTSNMRKDLRRGKVLIDWSQNSFTKTTVCVYSLRARERPTVSAPLRWEEVEAADDSGDVAPLRIESAEALARVEREGDLFAPVLELQQELPAG
jgi:bifunctional non-homologous end joining protein LigD